MRPTPDTDCGPIPVYVAISMLDDVTISQFVGNLRRDAEGKFYVTIDNAEEVD